jgi:hypothetical protein
MQSSLLSVVKRGCAKKDARYKKTGCEEQITGEDGFKVVLCICNGDLCNGNGDYTEQTEEEENGAKENRAAVTVFIGVLVVWFKSHLS